MCRKIRCDGESCKVLGFWVYLNKALVVVVGKIQSSDLKTTWKPGHTSLDCTAPHAGPVESFVRLAVSKAKLACKY